MDADLLRRSLIEETKDYYLITSHNRGYLFNPNATVAELITDLFNRSGLDYAIFDIIVNGKSLFDQNLNSKLNECFDYNIIQYSYILLDRREHYPKLVKLLDILGQLKDTIIPYNLISCFQIKLYNNTKYYRKSYVNDIPD